MKAISNFIFSEALIKKPIAVNWNFTDLCNFRCHHCYSVDIRGNNQELGTEDALKVVNILHKNDINMITFGGGESLLRTDIFAILKECQRLNKSVRIISNGYIINDDICRELKTLEIDQILISLDGASSQTHDKFRNREGSFSRVMNAIKLCKRYGIEVMVLTNFNKNNLNERRDIFNLLRQIYMREMGIYVIYPGPNLSKRNKAHKVYPYLLRNLPITRANQVWGVDITYVSMSKGWMYLFVIIDWYLRCIIDYEISNTMETGFIIEILQRAFKKAIPEIINNDQGSQFTSYEYIDLLKEKPC